MTKTKKRILTLVLSLFLIVTCLGFVGCQNAPNALSIDKTGINVAQGATLDAVLADITLTYDDTSEADEDESFTGLTAMQAAGVSVIWSGSNNEEGVISFSYKGYTLSVEYTVTIKS